MQFRLRDFAYPWAILRRRRELARLEWASADAQVADQVRRLRELLVHARAHCPFWRGRLDRAGIDPAALRSPEDLRALPLLTKDEVRAHAVELHADDAARFGIRESSTSGSTGTALRFLLDKPTNVLEFATLWRQFNRAGYRFGERFADLRGHLIAHPGGIERDRRLNSLNLSAFDLTRERARVYAAALRRFRPVMVRGYPSSIALFSAWALEEGLELPRPRAVVTSSETLLDEQRALIERAFAAPVFDYYGQMERVAFAGQCAAGRWHVAMEYGVLELLDPAGRPAARGEIGRIVATGLHHRAMPFLRYETRDLAAWAAGPCACGRHSPGLARIDGRLEDIVVTPEGRHVGRLDAAFQHSPGIRLAQIVQDEVASLRVRIVPGAGFSAGDTGRLLAELRLRLGPAIAIHFETVESIAPQPSGKLKFVVSRVAPSVTSAGVRYHREP